MNKKLLVLILLVLIVAPKLVLAEACVPGGGTGTTLCNPIDYAGDFKTFAFKVIQTFTAFFAITAMVMIIFSGFRMIMAQGQSEGLTAAKSAFQWSLSGLVLGMFAFVIVSAIANLIGVRDLTGSDIGNIPLQNPLGTDASGARTFMDLLMLLLTGFLGVVGLIAVLMIVISGIRYSTAQGNEEQASSAKTSLTWSIVGLIVVALSYVIVRATLNFFNP